MNKHILVDNNIVLDFLLQREGYPYAKQIFEQIFDGELTGFLPTSAIPPLTYILDREARKQPDLDTDWQSALRTLISYIHLVTVTGTDVLEALEGKNDIEERLMEGAVKRVCPDAIVLTNDRQFPQILDVITPQGFVNQFVNQPRTVPASIPLLDLPREYHQMMEEIDHALLSVAASSKFIMGPEVPEFETKCAEYIGTQHAIGISSGTEALVLALRALAIQRKGEEFFNPADLIITTPFTFTATGDAILRAGAIPLFVDVEPDGFNLDANQLVELIKTGQLDPTRVVGMLPVHLFGHPSDMAQILDLSREYNWFVLEDVAQAFGAKWRGQPLGSLGTMGAFSFFPTKNLGGFGDGGLVTTDDDELTELVRMLLRHGGKNKYNVDHIGYNARLDTLQAAVLLVRLKYVDQFNQKRKQIAETYNQALVNHSLILTPECCETCYDVVHQYTVRIEDNRRDQVQKHLTTSGISTAVYYPVPLHQMEVFAGRSEVAGQLTRAEHLCSKVLSLPIEPLMNETEVTYVAETMLSVIESE